MRVLIDRPSQRGYVLSPLVGTSPPPGRGWSSSGPPKRGRQKLALFRAAVEAPTRMTYKRSPRPPRSEARDWAAGCVRVPCHGSGAGPSRRAIERLQRGSRGAAGSRLLRQRSVAAARGRFSGKADRRRNRKPGRRPGQCSLPASWNGPDCGTVRRSAFRAKDLPPAGRQGIALTARIAIFKCSVAGPGNDLSTRHLDPALGDHSDFRSARAAGLG